MSEGPQPQAGRIMARLFGGVLVCIGFLIAGLSGLCSLAALTMVRELGFGNILAFGGVPFAIGAALAAVGMAILRNTRQPPRPTLPPASFTEPD